MKKLILLAAIVAMAMAGHAQRFDWVRTYSGNNCGINIKNLNRTVGSFVDNDGNTYILGECSPKAKLFPENDTGGVDLLPPGIYPIASPPDLFNNKCVVIAKLSPEGNLVWHKAIYGTETSNAYALCQLGDTAFMVMVSVDMMSHYYGKNLWYLDKLITPADKVYPMPNDSSCSDGVMNCFITFDFDGNVIEQHFIEVGYIDSSGRAITWAIQFPRENFLYPNALSTQLFSLETFAVDRDGNIYIARMTHNLITMDENGSLVYYTAANGKLSAMKIMVDGSHSFVYPFGPQPLWNQQILKFSPHFDSLLGGVYVFDSTAAYADTRSVTTKIQEMVIDSSNNLYTTLFTIDVPSGQHHIGNSNSLYFDALDGNSPVSVVIVYDQNLHARHLVHLKFSYDSSVSGLHLRNPYIDYKSNSLFLTGCSKWFWHSPYTLYNGDTLNISRNGTFLWLRLDLDDMSLLSYGLARPTTSDNQAGLNGIVAKNNRVFSQIKFYALEFADTIIDVPYGDNLALLKWDYDGNELSITDYHIASTGDELGDIHIRDSAVYLLGTINSDATFGSIHHYGDGGSHAYIAKYIDTSLREHSNGIRRPAVVDKATVYPNPTNGIVNIRCDGERIRKVHVISSHGRTMTAKPRGNTIDLSTLPSGIYYLRVKTDKTTHTQKIIKL